MVKHLVRHGNSYAMIIDKAILELIRADADTPFEIVSDGRSLVLMPMRDETTDAELDASIERLHTRFGRALGRLED